MTGQPATAEEGAGKEHEESFWASFTRADRRLFLITFAGTVAANVVTVMVVAIALIVARPPPGVRPTPAAVLLDLGVVVIGLMTIGIGVAALRRWRPRDTTSRANDMVTLVLTVVMGLFTLVFLLVLLGYAVGVK
jgi:hypothetical protein